MDSARLDQGHVLNSLAPCAFIARYREDISSLHALLESEGFAVEAPAVNYSPDQLEYSQIIRCLLTHRQIWSLCRTRQGYSLVVEADFVPVRGLGRMPPPFSPTTDRSAFAWLYACSPTVYTVSQHGFAVGDASSTVAYVLDAPTAAALVEFSDTILAGPNPGAYRPWDSQFRTYLRHRKEILTYLPFRQYGEHGGHPNREHWRHHRFPQHRADCLYGPLAYLPAYAAGSRTTFARVRALAKFKGVLRLVLGRTVPCRSFWINPDRRVLAFALRRLLCLY